MKKFMVCWISNWQVLPITKEWEIVSVGDLYQKLDDLIINEGVCREDIKVAEYFGE